MWRTDRCAEITKGTIDCDERMRSSPNRRRLNYDFTDAISFVACMRRRRPDQLKSTNLIDLRKTQIYTKRGNVEMPLTGHMSDFDNAILLDKITLIKTNALIQVRFPLAILSARMCSMRIRLIDSIHLVRLWLALFQEAGMKKLDIMQMVASYRRRVQYYQWKLDTLKMKIDDMNACKRTIEKCVVRDIWWHIESFPREMRNIIFFSFPFSKGHQRNPALAAAKARRSHRRHIEANGTRQKQSAAGKCGKFVVSTASAARRSTRAHISTARTRYSFVVHTCFADSRKSVRWKPRLAESNAKMMLWIGKLPTWKFKSMTKISIMISWYTKRILYDAVNGILCLPRQMPLYKNDFQWNYLLRRRLIDFSFVFFFFSGPSECQRLSCARNWCDECKCNIPKYSNVPLYLNCSNCVHFRHSTLRQIISKFERNLMEKNKIKL